MMLALTIHHPKISHLGMSWSDALELTPRQRDRLLERIDDIQSKQIRAMRGK